jgi:hypothetical protein
VSEDLLFFADGFSSDLGRLGICISTVAIASLVLKKIPAAIQNAGQQNKKIEIMFAIFSQLLKLNVNSRMLCHAWLSHHTNIRSNCRAFDRYHHKQLSLEFSLE